MSYRGAVRNNDNVKCILTIFLVHGIASTIILVLDLVVFLQPTSSFMPKGNLKLGAHCDSDSCTHVSKSPSVYPSPSIQDVEDAAAVKMIKVIRQHENAIT